MAKKDEEEFARAIAEASLHYGAPKQKAADRAKAERRAVMTEKQRTRGASGGRTVQINFRSSPSFKKHASRLARHMAAKLDKNVSLAEVIEMAVYALEKAEGLSAPQDEK